MLDTDRVQIGKASGHIAWLRGFVGAAAVAEPERTMILEKLAVAAKAIRDGLYPEEGTK